jgi:hypothetical protein
MCLYKRCESMNEAQLESGSLQITPFPRLYQKTLHIQFVTLIFIIHIAPITHNPQGTPGPLFPAWSGDQSLS